MDFSEGFKDFWHQDTREDELDKEEVVVRESDT